MKLNKSGVTLVELMVVVAIMAVLLTFTTFTISALTGAKGKDCATKIVTAMEQTRVYAMSHSGEYPLEIYLDDGGNVIIDSYNGTQEAGKHGVSVTYQMSGSDEEVALGDKSNSLKFTFKQTTGSFNGVTCEYINVYSNGFRYRLHLYKTTGKVEMTKEAVS